MPTVSVEREDLQELFGRRDALVQAITAGMASGEWDPVMRAFDGLLMTITRLEEGRGRTRHE
jgi:hypothetical protein